MNKSRHFCCNCGHSSALKSNFKLTNNGKAYCVKNDKCQELYHDMIKRYNEDARQEGDFAR